MTGSFVYRFRLATFSYILTPSMTAIFWQVLNSVNSIHVNNQYLSWRTLLFLWHASETTTESLKCSSFQTSCSTLLSCSVSSRSVLQKLTVSHLWAVYKDLPHPPATYLRLPPISVPPSPLNNVTYAFRTADGSYYNPLLPALGKAGSPYARSVPALNPVPSASLPDSGLLFDTLLARDKFEGHPGGLSSTFFALADLVIHTLFNTSSDGYNNNTSSYVDLSILYGNSDAQLDSVRGEKDGTGSILPDTFADPRLLMMPPAACALLVLLSRNHNVQSRPRLKLPHVYLLTTPTVHRTTDPRNQRI